MKYTTIIILVILLVCIYQMHSSEERFMGSTTGGRNKYTNVVDRSCADKSQMSEDHCIDKNDKLPLTNGKCDKGYKEFGSGIFGSGDKYCGKVVEKVCHSGLVPVQYNDGSKEHNKCCPKDYPNLVKFSNEFVCSR